MHWCHWYILYYHVPRWPWYECFECILHAVQGTLVNRVEVSLSSASRFINISPGPRYPVTECNELIALIHGDLEWWLLLFASLVLSRSPLPAAPSAPSQFIFGSSRSDNYPNYANHRGNGGWQWDVDKTYSVEYLTVCSRLTLITSERGPFSLSLSCISTSSSFPGQPSIVQGFSQSTRLTYIVYLCVTNGPTVRWDSSLLPDRKSTEPLKWISLFTSLMQFLYLFYSAYYYCTLHFFTLLRQFYRISRVLHQFTQHIRCPCEMMIRCTSKLTNWINWSFRWKAASPVTSHVDLESVELRYFISSRLHLLQALDAIGVGWKRKVHEIRLELIDYALNPSSWGQEAFRMLFLLRFNWAETKVIKETQGERRRKRPVQLMNHFVRKVIVLSVSVVSRVSRDLRRRRTSYCVWLC